MAQGRRVRAAALLVAALALTAVGQFYFFYHRGFLWDGLIFHVLGAVFFVLAWRTARVRSSVGRAPYEDRARTLLLVLGLILSGVAVLLSYARSTTDSTKDVVLVWVLSILAVLLAVLWPGTSVLARPRVWRLSLLRVGRKTWLEIAAVAGVVLLAFLLRAMALEHVPYTVGGDEAWHGLLARQVLSGELRNPFVMGYLSMPTFFYWPLSWSLWLVGDDVVGLRFLAALVGALTIVALYLFARRLWGPRIALVGAVVLATYEYHVHFSRLGASNVWDPLFAVVTMGLLDSGLTAGNKEKGRRLCVLAGLAIGVSVFFYTGARLLPLLVLVYAAFLWVGNAYWERDGASAKDLGPRLASLLLAYVVVAAPMLAFAVAQPDDWNARVNQVGIVQSGWLAQETALTERATLNLLSDQFLRAAGAFHVFADRTVWYGAERPLLGFLAGLFAILGMAWALLRWRDRRYFLVLLWFWAVVIAGGMLTESPPSSQRLVMAAPAVALLVAFGLTTWVRLAQRILGLKQRFWAGAAVTALTVIIGVLSVRYYFLDLAPSRLYGSNTGETATTLGHYLEELDGAYDVYLYGAPEIYWSFGTMSFLAPLSRGHDVVEVEDAPQVIDQDRVLFVFLPERVVELDLVREMFSDGLVEQVRDRDGRVRFTIYRLD